MMLDETAVLYMVTVVMCCLLAVTLLALVEAHRLRKAIRYHRDQKANDRCWIDDVTLYQVLPEGAAGLDTSLPSRDAFLTNCARYHDQRQAPSGCPYRK